MYRTFEACETMIALRYSSMVYNESPTFRNTYKQKPNWIEHKTWCLFWSSSRRTLGLVCHHSMLTCIPHETLSYVWAEQYATAHAPHFLDTYNLILRDGQKAVSFCLCHRGCCTSEWCIVVRRGRIGQREKGGGRGVWKSSPCCLRSRSRSKNGGAETEREAS